MKLRERIGSIWKKKSTRYMVAGTLCLVAAATAFAFVSGIGVRAQSLTLGGVTLDLTPIDGATDAYWIETADQLAKLGNATEGTNGKTFQLKNDITIGTQITAPATGTFAGTFDGGGHVITYEDIAIAVTDVTPTSESKVNGVLFGTVTGTGRITNLIVDVQDTDASYTRSTMGAVNATEGEPVYENNQNPLISNDAIHALTEVVEGGVTYKTHTLQEAGTKTTTYQATPGTDYFGLLCGSNAGTIEKVFLTGNEVSIARTEQESQSYSQSVQSGYREETYYYKQETSTETGTAVTETLNVNTTNGTTDSAAATFSNDLTATLAFDGSTTLTLTLENTNTMSGSDRTWAKDIEITTVLTDWTKDTVNSTATDFDVNGTKTIPAGTKVVLTKTVDSASVTSASITLTAALTTKTYTYTYDESKGGVSDVFNPVGTSTTSGASITSGNRLYAGGIAGQSTGSISKVKQSVNLKGTAVDGEFAIGGIAGTIASVDKLSDIYMLGKVNDSSLFTGNDTELSSIPGTWISGEVSSAPNTTNWSSYKKYNEAKTVEEHVDLAWLVKQDNFSYGTPSGGSIAVTLEESARQTSKELKYTIGYNVRKSMEETTEDNLYISTTGSMDLGASGYYRLLNTYATDGYYHYCSPMYSLTSAVWVYPYHTDNIEFNPYTLEELPDNEKVFHTDNPFVDLAQVKIKSAASGTVYYNINHPDSVPYIVNSSDPNVEDSSSASETIDTDGKVQLPFDMEKVTYRITPVIDDKIYPTQQTTVITQALKTPLPKPEVTCYDYYNAAGNKNTYKEFTLSASYEAGTDMQITPVNDSGNESSYSIRYLYSSTAYGSNDWITDASIYQGRYTGSDRSFMNDALVYTDGAVIPQELAGQNNVYLYVEISKKNYDAQIYRYGPFAVTESAGITAQVNGATTDNNTVLDGDIVTLSLKNAPEGAKILYWISTTPQTNIASWETPDTAPVDIQVNHTTGSYLYAKIKYSDNAYSPVIPFVYSFGEPCADPRITPNTGLSRNGTDAAATIEQTTAVTLSSRTEGSQVYYLISDTSQTVTMTRVSRPEDISDTDNGLDGIEKDGKKYFQVGTRWYQASSTDVQRYTGGLHFPHNEKEAKLYYISAVAISDGYTPSNVLEFIYKVQPKQQVVNPEAAYETRYTPGGENVDTATVSKGSTLSFFSVTPGAELYYATGSGTAVPAELIPDTGVPVDGEYGGNFVVRVQAKQDGMLDSEIITFIYRIAEQESVNAPTATPGTAADVPATVLPGNKILLSTTTKGASIYYTTDGSSPVIPASIGAEPGEGSTTYLYNPSNGILIPEGSGYYTITAVAVKEGLARSPETRFTYAYPEAVEPPYANVYSGKVERNTQIVLKNLTENAVIYYNAAYGENVREEDVPDPTLLSAVFNEEYPFTITQRTIIKAIAVKNGRKSAVAAFIYDPMAQLSAPTASIESGSVVPIGTALQLKTEEGASVYYTMDGSDPTDSSNTAVMSGNRLTLSGEAGGQVTIKAYAAASDKSRSEVSTFTYQFSQETGGVTASIENGSLVSNGTKVILMTDVTGADIYYTTDGSSPVINGKKGTTVEINGTPGGSFTIKAVAKIQNEAGMVSTFIYRIKERPTAPTASPSGGTLTVAARVSLSSGAEKIYYTTDGTEPTRSSNLYSEPILINRTTTLKAIAVSEDGEISDVAVFQYTAAAKAGMPKADRENAQTLEPGTTVSLWTDTQNAVIYYTTDGTDPTVDRLDDILEYDEDGIEINRTVTIKAVAYREDLQLSNVSTWTYIVDTIPAVEMKEAEAAKLAEEGLRDTDASDLARSGEKTVSAGSILLQEQELGTQILGSSDAFPEQAALETTLESESPYTVEKVKEIFGEENTVLGSYRLRVKSGSIYVQPGETVEIALPIEKGYEDAALSVALVDREHNLTTLETRREEGVIYAKTQKLGSYVMIGPERDEAVKKAFPYLLVLECAAGITALAGAAYFIRIKWKKFGKRKKDYPNE